MEHSEALNEHVMDSVRPLVRALYLTLGPHTEVVLHDLRREDGTIVEIAGEVTGRHVGGAMSAIGLSLVAQGARASDQLNYVTSTSTGKIVRSSTVFLRDEAGQPFGALCVNIDVTTLQRAANTLLDLAGISGPPRSQTVFSDDPENVIDQILQRFLASPAGKKPITTREGRRAAVAVLDKAGAFRFKRAVPYIASRLGVSRATLYADLAEVRDVIPLEPVHAAGTRK